ncbi:MAG TPA: M20 family metallopeptidase [Synergistales bacterium]|nr:M20 family metallopeptidase [Synergistales bacterium]
MADIKERARALNGEIVEWRRHIHKNPETGFETPMTEAFIVERLREMGIEEIRTGVGKHGVTALIKGERPGRVLGMRADIDALPVKEETGLSFASVNGRMHACGHDAHVAILLGTAKMLAENRKDLPGSVKLIFQPSEENSEGAPAMIKDGVLENPPMDAIIGLHTGNLWEGPSTGMVGYRYGVLMAATDWFTVTFEGKGGHGATPHLTVDPVAMACQAYLAIQTIVSRETSPLNSAVITVGSINGGSAPNVIGPRCTISGTIRSLDAGTRAMLSERLKTVCEGIAQSMRGRAEVQLITGAPPLINDREITDKLREAAVSIVGEEAVTEIAEPTMGGEDMAFFMERVPGCFFFLPSTPGEGEIFPHHHPKFDLDESVLWIGSAVMAHFAMTWQ